MNYRTLILKEMYDRLSDEDKRAYMFLRMQDNAEIMQSLDRIEKKIQPHSFFFDVLSNVTGNAIFDGSVYLVSSLLKRF